MAVDARSRTVFRLEDDRKFIPTVLLSRGNRRESSPGSVFLETARIYGRLILGEEKVTSSSPGSLGRPNSVCESASESVFNLGRGWGRN